MSRKTLNILSILIGILGIFIAIGVRTFLHPCLHEDGSAAPCAGAGTMIFWLGILLGLFAAGTLCTKKTLRVLLVAGMLVLSVLLILAPGVLRPICGMNSMRCHLVTQPAARVAGALAAVLSLISLIGAIRHKGE